MEIIRRRSGRTKFTVREMVPVEGFVPGVEYLDHPQYLELIELVTVEQVEYCKALVLEGGCKALAFRRVFPDASAATQNTKGSSWARTPNVARMYTFLNGVYAKHIAANPPITREEIKEKLVATFRAATSGSDVVRLRNVLHEYDPSLKPEPADETPSINDGDFEDLFAAMENITGQVDSAIHRDVSGYTQLTSKEGSPTPGNGQDASKPPGQGLDPGAVGASA